MTRSALRWTKRIAPPLALLACACVVAARPVPPPPPPPTRVIAPQAAVDIGTTFARSRGLVVERTVSTWLDRRARWHVDLAGAAGRDRVTVLVDGYTGRVLRATLHGGAELAVPGAPPPTPPQPPPPPAGAPPPPPPTSELPPPPAR